jgi:hypothetical protein
MKAVFVIGIVAMLIGIAFRARRGGDVWHEATHV